jgi:hypothetical protein
MYGTFKDTGRGSVIPQGEMVVSRAILVPQGEYWADKAAISPQLQCSFAILMILYIAEVENHHMVVSFPCYLSKWSRSWYLSD